MPEYESELFEAAVKPLAAQAEMRLAAINLLEKSGNPSQQADAVARWKRVDEAGTRPWLRWLFITALCAFSIWAWVVAGNEAQNYWRLEQVSLTFKYSNNAAYSKSVRLLDKCLPSVLTLRQRELLLGDITKNTRVEAAKALWGQYPEDPAYYMEYVFSQYENKRRSEAPMEFLESARRLDPGNAWPIYAAASLKQQGAIKEVERTQAERKAKVACSWEVLDQTKLDECIVLLHEASEQPRFDTHQERLMKSREGLVPVKDHLGYLTAAKVAWPFFWGSNESPRYYLSLVPSLVAAKSQQCVSLGNKDEFVHLMSDLGLLMRRFAGSEIDSEGPEIAMDESLWRAIPRLRESAASLGLDLNSHSELQPLLPQPSHSDDLPPDGFYEWFENHSGTLLSEFRPFYSAWWYPKWSEDDLKPGRMADHELLSRGCCLVLWVAFGLCLGGLALYQIRLPGMIRKLAARICQLLDAKDRVWIIGGGILAPYAYTMAINHVAPLGGQGWSIVGNHYMMPMAQFCCMAVMMILAPIHLVRWRLGLKSGVVGLKVISSRFEIYAIICAAISIPVSGWLASSQWFLAASPLLAFCVGLSVVCLLSNSARALVFSEDVCLLGCAVVSRSLMPAYAVAMLLMAMAAPVHKAAERAWFRQDTTMTSVPGFPGVSPFDYRVAEEMRRRDR